MNDYYTQISDHAHGVPQQEVCGFLYYDDLGSLRAERARNASISPTTRFELADRDQLTARRHGRLAAYYHSHWENGPEFSDSDIRHAKAAALPIFCYSTHTRTFNLYKPPIAVAPYLGRQFVCGFQDCASLVTDYYTKEVGHDLPYFARPQRMVEDGFKALKFYLEACSFVPVTAPYVKGDILAFSIRSQNGMPNHVAVVLDSETIIHQLSGQLSSMASLHNWTDRVLFAMRLKIQR